VQVARPFLSVPPAKGTHGDTCGAGQNCGLSDVPEFLATAELAEVLDFDPAWLGRRLAELGCQSTRERVMSEDGRTRQIRGYLTADLLVTAAGLRDREAPESSDGEP
jgi:hypothetical protein